MSGYEPGRPKIELREAQYIWNGTRILNEYGVEATVESFKPMNNHVVLDIRYKHSRAVVPKLYRLTELVRCRVEPEDR